MVVRMPMRAHQPTQPERSARLGAPGGAAGDVEAIVEQATADKKAVLRRAKLIREAEGGPVETDVLPHDDLADKSTGKTVDDLVK